MFTYSSSHFLTLILPLEWFKYSNTTLFKFLKSKEGVRITKIFLCSEVKFILDPTEIIFIRGPLPETLNICAPSPISVMVLSVVESKLHWNSARAIDSFRAFSLLIIAHSRQDFERDWDISPKFLAGKSIYACRPWGSLFCQYLCLFKDFLVSYYPGILGERLLLKLMMVPREAQSVSMQPCYWSEILTTHF